MNVAAHLVIIMDTQYYNGKILQSRNGFLNKRIKVRIIEEGRDILKYVQIKTFLDYKGQNEVKGQKRSGETRLQHRRLIWG